MVEMLNRFSGTGTGDSPVRGEFDLVTARADVRADEKLSAFLELDSAIRKNSIDTVSRCLSESRSR